MAAAAALAVTMTGSVLPAKAETVLRVIPHADLKNLDPIWTTAYISRNHGYLIYDTLFAMDENFEAAADGRYGHAGGVRGQADLDLHAP
jgi:peptide/nickel transport system substrate-binding protein